MSRKTKLFFVLTLVASSGVSFDLQARSNPGTSIEREVIQQEITGQVSDKNGPIVGASVAVKGSAIATYTDQQGHFKISKLNPGAILVVSYVGYRSQELKYEGQKNLAIVLDATSTDLDEVIVVAYGTAKKSTFTGSATVVKKEQLEKIGGSGFAETLQGMSPGVSVTNNEGNPGGDSRIQIRGISSMSGSSNPLYVVDGMPYDGQLTSIAPSDIESITVLKDAAASSLYGSRAANGVIVITTKKGKSAKPTLNFKSAWGTSDNAIGNPTKATPEEQLLNTWEGMYNDQFYRYNRTSKEAGDWASANVLGKLLKKSSAGVYVSPFKDINENYVLHDGNGNPYINPKLQKIWNESDYDYYGAVFSRKLRQEYNLDVSGTAGDGKTNYFLSSNYLDDKGYAMNQYFKRYGFRANVTSQVTDWLQLGGNMSFSSSRQNLSGASRALDFSTTLTSPWLRNADNTDWVYSEKTGRRMYDYGTYGNNFFGIHVLNNGGDYWDNPNDEGFTNNQRNMISARYFAGIKLPYNLNFKSSISIDNNVYKEFTYGSAVHGPGQQAPYGTSVLTSGGSAGRVNNETRAVTFNNILTWEQDFGAHHLSALAGQESYTRNVVGDNGYGEGIMQLGQYELTSTTTNWSVGSYKDRYALLSYLAKVDYNYDDKYFASVSFRRDGSSRFHPDNRWGNFLSGGLSWKISKENFLKEATWLDNLSFRSSYGTTGNDRLIQRQLNGVAGGEFLYAYQAYYSADNLYGLPGLKPNTVAAPDLQWEKNKQFNVAADFAFLKRFYGTIEYYSRNSTDLLYYKEFPLSAQAGAAIGQNMNLGNLKNSGFEFSLGADIFRKDHFNWKVDGNLSTLKNEVTYLPSGAFTFNNRGAGYRLEEGHSLYDFYMVKNAGVNPDNGNMQYWVKDDKGGWKISEDYVGEVTSDDYQWIGSALPKVYGSLTNSFKVHGLDFSFMFYYSLGGKMYDYSYSERSTLRGGVGVTQELVQDRWRKPGDHALLPKWSDDNYASTRRASDFYIFDNDYVRLRNITLGYSIPKNTLQRMGLANVRFFVSADNLLTFGSAKNRYTEPETGLSGNNYNGNADTDNGRQGARRIYTGGLQVTF